MSELRPVHQIEAEASLLGGCLIDGISPAIAPKDLFTDKYRLIAEAMQQLDREGVPIDPVTVYERLSGQISGVELAELMNRVPNANNADVYAQIVREYACARRLQNTAAEFLRTMNQEQRNVRDCVNRLIGQVIENSDPESHETREQAILQPINNFMTDLDSRIQNPGLTGIATGIEKLDTAMNGLSAGDLLIIAARPSMGKTTLALNMASNTAAQGYRTQFYPLEMSTQQNLQRIISSHSKVPLSAIRSGNMTGTWYIQIHEAIAEMNHWPLFFIDSSCTELDIIRKVRKYRPQIVFVDYLQLVRPSIVTGNANYDIGNISKAMKQLARDQQIPIVLLCQLNRSVAKERRLPRLDDLRDAGQIEQDADAVLFIHSNDHMDSNRDLLLAKNRQGETTVWQMDFRRNIQLFEDAA